MPKIFLLKNRLHQQQQRLLEAQHLSKSPPPGSGKDSPLGGSEPLSLIVNKHQCKFLPFPHQKSIRIIGNVSFSRDCKDTRSSFTSNIFNSTATRKYTEN